MRAYDCDDPGTHEKIHFTAEDDSGLEQQVGEHIREQHPDMNPAEAKDMVSQGAYDE